MPDTSEAGDGHKEGDRMGYVLTIGFSMVLWVASMAYAEAASYYVSPSGGGSTCSSGAPCSLNTGIGRLTAGDTLFLKGGTYSLILGHDPDNPPAGTPNQIPSGTSWSSVVTIAAAPGETPIIPGIWLQYARYIVIDGKGLLVLDGQLKFGIGIALGGHHIRVQSTEIRNFREQGILGCDDGFCEFINMNVHDNGNGTCFGDGLCHGLYTHGQAVTVDGGRWYNHFDGYGLHFYPNPSHTTVRNARVYSNRDGMVIQGDRSAKVYNNIVYNNWFIGIRANSSMSQWHNNTIYNNGEAGIYIDKDGNDVRNNIIFNNRGEGNIVNLGSNTLSNNLTTNPKFVNAGTGDFRLQAGSPAIDMGVTISAVTTDFDKRPRPQGTRFDIGAYEYTGSAPRPLSASTTTDFKTRRNVGKVRAR
jgi:parallel beta-helix repeat protein